MKINSSKSTTGAKTKDQAVSKKSAKEHVETKSDSDLNSDSESDDIVALILEDHKPIKELILILKDPEITISKKKPAFVELEQTLSPHAKAEEESLYVHLKKVDDLRMEGLEGDTEHALAVQLMKEANECEDDDEAWMAKIKVLVELVDHHVKEEEKDMLKMVRKDFSLETRVEIGKLYSRLLSQHRKEDDKSKKFIAKGEIRAPNA